MATSRGADVPVALRVASRMAGNSAVCRFFLFWGQSSWLEVGRVQGQMVGLKWEGRELRFGKDQHGCGGSEDVGLS